MVLFREIQVFFYSFIFVHSSFFIFLYLLVEHHGQQHKQRAEKPVMMEKESSADFLFVDESAFCFLCCAYFLFLSVLNCVQTADSTKWL